MDGQVWLDDVHGRYRYHKSLCERAAAQVSDADFFRQPGGLGSSIAVVMKHLAGNNRSRWRDFLTVDGEKRERNRESEFDVEGETRASIQAQWDQGWAIALAELEALTPADLERTVTIRGEPLGVVPAIERNLNHAAYHTGQIVQLARTFAGDAWESLSIPRGKSDDFNATMRERFGDWWRAEGGG